jgi:hypothetical protein
MELCLAIKLHSCKCVAGNIVVKQVTWCCGNGVAAGENYVKSGYHFFVA